MFETPEELYQVLMVVRSGGVEPPYVFIFSSEEVKRFLDQCTDEDFARITQDDVHIVIEFDGEFFRFVGFDGGKSTFETPVETVH